MSLKSDIDWEQRVALAWAKNRSSDLALVAEIERLASERPVGDPVAAFELASVHDWAGNEARAERLYRQALSGKLSKNRRRRATIQLASTLRNLGRADESIALLSAERLERSDDFDDAIAAFLALALVDVGREREAVALALDALSRHIPIYKRAVTSYAKLLVQNSQREADQGSPS